MMNLLVTGASGFVGLNLLKYLEAENHSIINYKRNNVINLANIDVVIHLAGKAHDLKNVDFPDEYYKINTDLTKTFFDLFVESEASVFIYLSSVKAVADKVEGELTESFLPNPSTHYGKSKLLAEQYILSKKLSEDKRVYILRPCMIHGPKNKGNLNLLYNLVSKGLPWPLGKFENARSFCSIENLCFIINEIITNVQIPSGVYNVADDEVLSTRELIELISKSQGKKTFILNVPTLFINIISKLSDLLGLPFNSERLNKLTETYIVSNRKIKDAINKPLPRTTRNGLLETFNAFQNAK